MTAITNTQLQRPRWRTIVLFILMFWLSSSLLLDTVIMPGLYMSGMMSSSGFASAGYSIFGLFNRIELLCAALVLTGILLLRHTLSTVSLGGRWAVPLALGLFTVALVYTYGLTPEMSALGLQLNLFDSATIEYGVPALMNQMHSSYWLLELFKLTASGALIGFLYRDLAR